MSLFIYIYIYIYICTNIFVIIGILHTEIRAGNRNHLSIHMNH